MSSDDSKQLSVAELLARNAAQGASSGGGGRRRKGRGSVSVNELAGDTAAPTSGRRSRSSSADYAPAYEPPSGAAAPYPPAGPPEPTYSPPSIPMPLPSYDQGAYPPVDPRDPLGLSTPASDPRDPLGLSAQSSGGVSAYDSGSAGPFGGAAAGSSAGVGPSSYASGASGSSGSADPFGPYRAEARSTSPAPSRPTQPGRLGVAGASNAQAVDPAIAEMFGSGALPAVGGGRRRRADDDEFDAPTPFEPGPAAPFGGAAPRATPPVSEPGSAAPFGGATPRATPPVSGGRAARRRAAEAAEEAAAPVSSTPLDYQSPFLAPDNDPPLGLPGSGFAGVDAVFRGEGFTPPASRFPTDSAANSGFGRSATFPVDQGGRDAARSSAFPVDQGIRDADFGGRSAAFPIGRNAATPSTDSRTGFDQRGDFNGSGLGFDQSHGNFPADPAAPGGPDFSQRGPGFDNRATAFPADNRESQARGAINAAFGPYAPEHDATQVISPAQDANRPALDRRRDAGKTSKLPSWSARRNRSNAKAEQAPAWAPDSQEQPLIAGQSVAGDLLRRQSGHDVDDRTEVYQLDGRAADDYEADDYASGEYAADDYADSDYDDRDYADNDYTDDHGDDDYDDDYEAESKPTRAGRRAATKAAASRMARKAKSRATKSRAASRVSSSRAAGRVSRLAATASDDDNRREWMMLGAQALGAGIAGMLLFKGFETLWESMALVALALAAVVILGLVALVRVLRRTDDIFSTVIAVVVGVFVTLGPLAFLLSTS
ncbi:hypothetical protein [Nocardia camponoti]|uniref:Uncharacterized protein n=1 Tax=Nocardia camponoti TaxID=1616106 RepID=A0A917QII8_9NOCA|nr:hypothetical protein [Nocardia camponoti]GGK50681.1 hypothetical protein GCM10011591_22790 [Nocardia camponoti]